MKTKRFFSKVFFNIVNQIIPIMLGVYLGFAINNYGEGRKMKKDKKVYEKMLFNEIKSNLGSIKRVLPYHMALKDSLIAIIEAEDPFQALNDYTMTGLNTPRLSDGVYQTGIQTGLLKEFDLNFIQFVNKLYKNQNHFDAVNQNILSSLIGRDMPDNNREVSKMVTSMIFNMNDIIAGENDLFKFYCEILTLLLSSAGEVPDYCETN